jgi:hypothetical protein
MGKSRKENSKRRNRKTRRHKLKGGSKTEAALYVWKDPDDKTLQKRIFVKRGINIDDSIADAVYQMRFFNDGFDNTIPRKIETDTDGEEVIHNINPYVKYLTADYSDGMGEVDDTARVDGPYVSPTPSAPPEPMAGDLNNKKIEVALKDVKKDALNQISKNLGILDEKTRSKKRIDQLIPLIIEKLIQK